MNIKLSSKYFNDSTPSFISQKDDKKKPDEISSNHK